MENLAGPRLLQAFFDHVTDDVVDTMNNSTKAALRLSCKNAKAFVDGTVTAAKGDPIALGTILRCDWNLAELKINGNNQEDPTLLHNAFNSLLNAVCSKFPTLQALEIDIRPRYYALPANIGQLSKLSTLKIVQTHFAALPASFGQLSSLERLEICNASVVSTQATIEGLAPLKQLTQLKYLKLTGCIDRQPFFPDWLGTCNFPVLEDLILGHGLPSSIGNFTSLTSLIIEQGGISEVPESISSLRLLKKLCLLLYPVSLPTFFSRLTTLEELHVKTVVESFAVVEYFHKLTNLRFVQLDEENTPYPEFLWTFTALQSLYLSGSSVPSLPDDIGHLQKLKSLQLFIHENMEELPETVITLTNLTSLEILDGCSLLKLPESIGNLKLLKVLALSCPVITTLPESLGQLQSLEKLALECFRSFERFPSSIGKLRALKELVVDDCGKVILPETFADLVLDKPAEECSLERVSFYGNTKVIISGLRSSTALVILWQRGVLHSDSGFNFSEWR
jgi:leucine-rich repeat protein SHOC2